MKRLTRCINRFLRRTEWPLFGHAHQSYFADSRRITPGEHKP